LFAALFCLLTADVANVEVVLHLEKSDIGGGKATAFDTSNINL